MRFLTMLVALLLSTQLIFAEDQKHPKDACPPGTHTVTITRSVDGQVKPGGVGVGTAQKESYSICRDNKSNNVMQPSAPLQRTPVASPPRKR